jgi:hypothetical protein
MITRTQLKEMIREAVREQMMNEQTPKKSTPKKSKWGGPARAGIPIALWASDDGNGRIIFTASSGHIGLNKIGGRAGEDEFDLPTKKDILRWVKEMLDGLEKTIKGDPDWV